eukprot:4112733-Amphidinium_carterae.1
MGSHSVLLEEGDPSHSSRHAEEIDGALDSLPLEAAEAAGQVAAVDMQVASCGGAPCCLDGGRIPEVL